MAGTYPDPRYTRSQPFHQPNAEPTLGRDWGAWRGQQLPTGRSWVQAVGARASGELAGLGALTTAQYSALSMIGATAGGAAVGYVSAGDTDGAINGGLFSGGLASTADAIMFARQGHAGAAITLGIVGVAAIGGALYRAFYR